MEVQRLLDQLRHELRQRGLPEGYIARYIDELREHITDLIEERTSTMSKDARTDAEVVTRIGDPGMLADVASVEFTRRSFFGRHPILTFLVAPMPLAVLAWAATFATLFGCATGVVMCAEWLGKMPPSNVVGSWPAATTLAAILFYLGVVGPPAVLNVLLCRLADRNGLSWLWSLTGCVMVALIAGMFQAVLEPATSADGHGRLMFGFGMWTNPPLRQWLQFAIPLLTGVGLLWRQTRRHGSSTPPLPDTTIVHRQAA
jgi:hypothetical protein